MPREGEGRTALVTGASAGIGRAFADVLAARGYALILTARRLDRLEHAAAALRAAHQVPVHVFAEDLADPAAPARLVDAIHAAGLTVDLLVNNAGYGLTGRYAGTSWADQHRFLQVMVVAMSEIVHRLWPGMIARGWGRVINVASLAGLTPAPAGHTLYAASKAFLIRFSEALAAEGAPHGAHATALCPGFTFTEFHDVTGTRASVSRMPRVMWLDAHTVAEQGYAAVMRGDPVWVSGRLNQLIAWLVRVMPQGAVRSAVRRSGSAYRKV